MRIISKFKDYYDSASGYGVDTTVVYNRTPKVLPNWSIDPEQQDNVRQYREIVAACEAVTNDDRFRNMNRYSDHNLVYVGLAGKIYVGLSFEVRQDDPKKLPFTQYSDADPTETLYAWHEGNLSDEQLARQTTYSRWESADNRTIADWFRNNAGKRVVENIDLFTKHNMVAFVATRQRPNRDLSVELNPCLRQYGFQRIMDGFTTFQEVSMFVSGVLAPADTVSPLPITDVERAATKGFDKRSFRK